MESNTIHEGAICKKHITSGSNSLPSVAGTRKKRAPFTLFVRLHMESQLASARPGTLFLGLWASIILLSVGGDAVPSLSKFFALVGFFVVWLAYPLVLVFISTVTKATLFLRGFVATNVAIFVVLFMIRSFDNSTTDRWLSAVGMIALLFIEFGAVRALTKAEQQAGLSRGGFSAWFSLFYLPFFGLFFIHKRHRLLVENAKPNPPLNRTRVDDARTG